MAVGPFNTHHTGFLDLLSSATDWGTTAYYAVLATTTNAPDRATWIDYQDIINEHGATGNYDQVALAFTGGSAVVDDTDVLFKCDKITFGADTTITARYLYILKGTAASPANGDLILGHVDLDGAGNVSSVGAEFSFTPNAANGLFRISQSAAA